MFLQIKLNPSIIGQFSDLPLDFDNIVYILGNSPENGRPS